MKRLFAILAALLLTACAGAPKEEAQTFIERVAYWNARVGAVTKTVDQSTCYRGYDAKGQCLDPGKPLKPAVGLQLLEQLDIVAKGLRSSVTIPSDGVGACMGQQATPEACLALASEALLQVEVLLREQGVSQ